MMSAQSESATDLVAGEYRVVTERRGQGIDHYLRVVGPDGRTTEQKVYWTYSMTAFEVAEAAVAGHLGPHEAMHRAIPTCQDQDGGYIVTLD